MYATNSTSLEFAMIMTPGAEVAAFADISFEAEMMEEYRHMRTLIDPGDEEFKNNVLKR
jgi:hypothetical protein